MGRDRGEEIPWGDAVGRQSRVPARHRIWTERFRGEVREEIPRGTCGRLGEALRPLFSVSGGMRVFSPLDSLTAHRGPPRDARACACVRAGGRVRARAGGCVCVRLRMRACARACVRACVQRINFVNTIIHFKADKACPYE